MVESAAIDLKDLTLEELSGVVSLYPWFSAARTELCRRMAASGAFGAKELATAALFMADRRKLASLSRGENSEDYSDKDVDKLLHSFMEPEISSPRVVASGADYFSQKDYDEAATTSDGILPKFGAGVRTETPKEERVFVGDFFCTETLAEIYLEQGYPEQARRIYSKLLLANPEKSAYFASLIEKLKD